MIAVAYFRYSDRPNATDSESIEFQKSRVRPYAESRGYRIAAEYEDRAISGADEDRPGLWDAVENCPNHGVLLVYRLDRLARGVYLSEVIRRELAKKHATVEAVEGGGNGESPEDTVLRQILQAFAEYERKIISLRISGAMRRHVKNGYRMGHHVPFGMMPGPDEITIRPDGTERRRRTIVPSLVEQAIIADIRGMVGTPFSIARALNERGTLCRGHAWHHQQVRRVLKKAKETS